MGGPAEGSSGWEREARRAYRAALELPFIGGAAAALMPARLRRAVRQSVLVEESARYALAAAVGAPGVRRYHLTDSGNPVLLRHPTDSWTFEEIFRAQVYAPPSEVERVLGRLPRAPRVLDVGANVGLFTRYVRDRWPDAHITALEPDPVNAQILRRHVSVAGDTMVEVLEAAASSADGSAEFQSKANARSRVVHNGGHADGTATILVQTVDVLPALVDADLVKLDVEGAEWPILADTRLGDGGRLAIVLEYHPEGCPSSDPKRCAASLLARAGFRIIPPPRRFGDDEFPDRQGMLWAMRD